MTTLNKQWSLALKFSQRCWWSICCLCFGAQVVTFDCLDPEDQGNKLLQNISNLPIGTASFFRKLESSTTCRFRAVFLVALDLTLYFFHLGNDMWKHFVNIEIVLGFSQHYWWTVFCFHLEDPRLWLLRSWRWKCKGLYESNINPVLIYMALCCIRLESST